MKNTSPVLERIQFGILLLFFSVFLAACEGGDSDNNNRNLGEQGISGKSYILVTKKHLLFFSNETIINNSHDDFESLMRHSKNLVNNYYGHRKTFNAFKDFIGGNYITVKYIPPILVKSQSFAGSTILVNKVDISFSDSETNIPIVINDDLPVFSKYDQYLDFISLINNIK